uniref:Ig-like domain-containing protein n=1 Tax=Meleagris gallopavo TaxID=9103 RepID=A0A803XZI0_MELGA
MDFLSFLLVLLTAVAVSRAQVQQEPSAEITEGTEINITCSLPNIQSNDNIHWYRQLPGQGPTFIASAVKGSKEVSDPEGRLWVSADRRSSALCLARPRLGDAGVYFCALVAQGEDQQGGLYLWPPTQLYIFPLAEQRNIARQRPIVPCSTISREIFCCKGQCPREQPLQCVATSHSSGNGEGSPHILISYPPRAKPFSLGSSGGIQSRKKN